MPGKRPKRDSAAIVPELKSLEPRRDTRSLETSTMRCSRSSRVGLAASVLVAASVLMAVGVVRARGQSEPGEQQPNLAQLEAGVDAAWKAALALPDDTYPMWKSQAWGVVVMSEVVLAQAKLQVAGGGAAPADAQGAAVVERVLSRWQQLRPRDAGPELFRLNEVTDSAARLAAVLAVLDRHPDDLMAIQQATMLLRQAGETQRAVDVQEGFLARHPDRPIAYRLLSELYSGLRNATRDEELLVRWAALAPDDPVLVSRWLSSGLAAADREATRRLLDRFFAERPTGPDVGPACLQAAKTMGPAYRDEAQACLARMASDPDLPQNVAESARSGLAELAATSGDWNGLLAALERLPPAERRRATLSAAGALPAPAQCDGRIALVRAAIDGASGDDYPANAGYVLAKCEGRPAAQALFLDIIRRVPFERFAQAINGWASNVNGRWTGELPAAQVAPILEARLAAEGESEYAFRALDIVYALAAMDDRRFANLRRWHERFPGSMWGREAVTLAEELAMRGQLASAATLLEGQLERRQEREVVDALAGVYAALGKSSRASDFAVRLMASDEPGRAAIGELLAARDAVMAGDLAGAERLYWRHVAGPQPHRDAGLELLAVVATQKGGARRLPEAAARICQHTAAVQGQAEASRCASDLLSRVGDPKTATAVLARQALAAPDDVESLRRLAQTATAGGQLELAEATLRRIVELDPRDVGGWEQLASFLEKQRKVSAADEVLARVRRTFAQPPLNVLRAVGRTHLAGGDPRRAIDLLREARAALPAGADPAWIDHELRQAYAALGEE